MESTLLYLTITCAATGAPDTAPVPRLGTAPQSSAWTIEYQYKSPNPLLKPPDPSYASLYEKMRSENPRLLSVQVIKAGNRRNEVYLYDDGTQTIWWVVGNSLVIDTRISHFLTFNNASDPVSPHFTHDFASLAWVDQADYQGHQTFQSTDCCVYYAKESGDHLEETAYINSKTGLPVAVQQPGFILSYKFRNSNQTVDLPPKVDVVMKRFSAGDTNSNP